MGVSTRLLLKPLWWDEPITDLEGPNERIVELSLAIGVMGFGDRVTILDAGCALNQGYEEPIRAQILHLTQNVNSEPRYEHPLRAYASGDLRDLSAYPDEAFDRVACISTLEHVGMNNTGQYQGTHETNPASVRQAVSELWRVTKDRLLITVPFRLEPWQPDNASWRYFTPGTLDQLTVPDAQIRYYAQAATGWHGPLRTPAAVDTGGLPPYKVQQIAVIYACR